MTEVEIQHHLLFISALGGVKWPSLWARGFTFKGRVLSSYLLIGPLRKTGRFWEGDNFLSCRQLNSCPSVAQNLLSVLHRLSSPDLLLRHMKYDEFCIT
jgi:hypothetical protein